MASVTEELGEFVASIGLSSLPPEVVDKAKACLLWGFCGSFTTDESYANNAVDREIAAAIASASPAAPGSGATVLANGTNASISDATFANAVLFDQTMCDSYLAAAHFAPAVLPPVLALAEQEGQSGAEVLQAIIAGYEVAGALTKDHLAPTMDRGWRGALIFGGLGAAAASARLMGLNAEEAANAIGFAAGMACGSMQPMYDRSMDNKLVMGINARNGLTSGWLARQRAKAARNAIEGKAGFLVHFPGTTDFRDRITNQLGEKFEILNVTFKRWEASGRAHTPMLLALRIAEEEDVDPIDIRSVALELNAFEEAYPPHREHDDLHMIDSVAGALTYRSGRSDLIVRHDNPVFLSVTEKIKIRPAPDLGPYCGRLRVTTSKGQYFREITDGPVNHAFDFEGTIELARTRQSKMRVTPDHLDKVARTIRNFESAPSVHPLIGLVTA
jgi:2-methylcitrate dehydratase PrpD